MIKFVVLAFPRSGSTYVCSRLNAHPQVLCHYEVFHPNEIATVHGFSNSAPEMKEFTPRVRDEDPARFLQALFRHDLGAQAVGFKIFIGHSKEAHDVILSDDSIAKVLLKRSTVDAYVSMQIAKRTGSYTRTSDTETTRLKVDIDAAGLLGFDAQITRYFADIEAALVDSGQRYLTVRYEDIVSTDDGINSIFTFLGIDRGSGALASFTARQNSEALEDKVGNLKQVLEDLVRFHRNRQ